MPLVWTGSGYEDLPVYDAGDFGMYGTLGSDPGGDSQGMTFNPATGRLEPWNTPTWGFSSEARQKYGDLFGGANPNNWMLASGGQGGMDFLLKSGDKEGTRVSYTLQDGKYVPTIAGTQQWDTNDSKQNAILGAMALAAGGGYLANGMLAPGAGSAAGGAAGGVTEGSAPWLAGSQVGTNGLPISTAGSTFTSAVGGAGLGGTATLPELLSGAGGLGGLGGSAAGGSSGLSDLLSSPSLLKGLGVLAGGLLGSRNEPQGAAGGPTPAVAQPVPAMYGGNALPPQFQTVGPTETERRMTQQYLPAMFSQAPMRGLLDGRMVPPIRRSLLMGG